MSSSDRCFMCSTVEELIKKWIFYPIILYTCSSSRCHFSLHHVPLLYNCVLLCNITYITCIQSRNICSGEYSYSILLWYIIYNTRCTVLDLCKWQLLFWWSVRSVVYTYRVQYTYERRVPSFNKNTSDVLKLWREPGSF